MIFKNGIRRVLLLLATKNGHVKFGHNKMLNFLINTNKPGFLNVLPHLKRLSSKVCILYVLSPVNLNILSNSVNNSDESCRFTHRLPTDTV